MFDAATNQLLLLCPHCGEEFSPKRTNQNYCIPTCQKNGSRGSRKIADSNEERHRSSRHYNRARGLAFELYTRPLHLRLGFMAELIEAARDHDAQLRSILTDPILLSAGREDKGLFHRRAPLTYKTISQAAHAYCRKFWGHGVKDVVYKRCPDPETGESTSTLE